MLVTCYYSRLGVWCSVQFNWSVAFNVYHSVLEIKKTSSRKKWYSKHKNSRSADISKNKKEYWCVSDINMLAFKKKKKKNHKRKIFAIPMPMPIPMPRCRCRGFQMAVLNQDIVILFSLYKNFRSSRQRYL